MKLPQHHAYKESGESWLGPIPAHWDARRLKNLFEIRKRIAGEEGHQILSITQRGIKIKDIDSNDGQISMDYSKYQLVEPGDFAMNHMDLLTGFVDISAHAGVTSPDYRVFTMREGSSCAPRYLLYLLQNGYRRKVFYAFDQGASEFGRWRFPTDQFNNFVFPCPPFEEQVAIARFLDHETAKIDALIAEQEKLIALLAEKRQATISRAVTCGLDPDVPMKDSGVPWLGNVPAHWEVKPIKWLSPVLRGASPRPIDDPKYFDEEGQYAWVRIADASASERVLLETTQRLSELGSSLSVRLEPGQLFVSIAGTVGKPCIAGIKCCIHDGFVYFPRIEINPLWLFWLFESGACFAGLGKRGTQLNLNTDTIGSIRIGLPPSGEVEAILRFIDGRVRAFQSLTEQAVRAVALLQERRSALITAAVTGQIDVRTAVQSDQEEAVGVAQ